MQNPLRMGAHAAIWLASLGLSACATAAAVKPSKMELQACVLIAQQYQSCVLDQARGYAQAGLELSLALESAHEKCSPKLGLIDEFSASRGFDDSTRAEITSTIVKSVRVWSIDQMIRERNRERQAEPAQPDFAAV